MQRKITVTAGLVSLMMTMLVQNTMAHDKKDQILSAGAGKVDVFKVHCPAPTVRLQFAVRDQFPGIGFITALVTKDNAATSYTDQTGGDLSPREFSQDPADSINLFKGAGDYMVYVSRTDTTGITAYDLYWHCRRPNGTEHNGSGEIITVIQDD